MFFEPQVTAEDDHVYVYPVVRYEGEFPVREVGAIADYALRDRQSDVDLQVVGIVGDESV
jgi:hypothetical protein